jgi:hypothetical protein
MSNIGHNSGIPNLSSDDVKKVAQAIQTINDSMTRVAAERDLVKETINSVCEELSFPKKLLRRMAKTYYKQSFESDVQEDQDFQNTYEAVTKKK